MSMTKIPAALFVIGAILLGVPAMAAPATPLSGAAKPMMQVSDLVLGALALGLGPFASCRLSLPSLLRLGRLDVRSPELRTCRHISIVGSSL